ncbi:MAG: class A beta-lactamase-related serine hydrolase [Verrucomicrobiaceae bacterium]|nr:MAG: class A beta-lactamase-related serine hydrolase [Verrucomicrobiaceae bacterium]
MAVSPSALGKVVEVFERNFRDRGELGASISIWWEGTELLSHGHGWCEREKTRAWTPETMVPVYSATKVPAAATLLVALESRGLSEETPVREVWPRFPVAGARFYHLLSHQCGLAALDQRAGVLDHPGVVAAIEAQTPAWHLGEGHGYHPRTFGALVDEPVRRLTGLPLGGYWREMIAGPLGLDFWIGLPQTEWPRVARLYPGKAGKDDLADAFYKQLTTSGTFTRRAFSSPRGLHAIHEMNEPRAWEAGLPALGGVGTASALAKFYQAAIGSIPSPLSARVRQALVVPRSAGYDRVLLRPTVFTCGAQQDPLDESGHKIRRIYGPSLSAFGHPGAGGSHGMGDPETGVSFAYVMNQMDLSVMPGLKCVEMVDALFSEL